MNNKHFLKSILTTTSTLALLIGATEVNATVITTALSAVSANPAHTATSTEFEPNLISGNSITLGMGNSLVVNSAITLAGIALDAYQPGELTVTENATIGSIANVREGESFTLNTFLNDGVTLTLNGTSTHAGYGLSASGVNKYDALGDVTIGNGAGVVINIAEGGVVFSNSFNKYDWLTYAALKVDNDGNIFTNNIYVNTLYVNGNTTIDSTGRGYLYVTTDNAIIAKNKTLTMNMKGHNFTWYGDIDGAEDGSGNLVISETTDTPPDYPLFFNNDIGKAHYLDSISLNDNVSIDLTFHQLRSKSLLLGSASSIRNPGLIESLGENGITLSGDVSILYRQDYYLADCEISSTKGINLNGHTLSIGSSRHDARPLKITGDLKSNVDGSRFVINNWDVILDGNVGDSERSLDAIHFGKNKTLTISGEHSIYSNITTSESVTGALRINGGDVSIFGDVGDEDYKLSAINFNTDNNLTISGKHSIYSNITTSEYGAGALRIDGGDVVLDGNVGAEESRISVINFNTDNNLTISGEHSIHSDITTSVDGTGVLSTKGGYITLYGNVGEAEHRLSAINFNIDHVLAMGGEYSIYSDITTSQDGSGILVIGGGDVSIFGNIGSGTVRLNVVGVLNDHNLTLSGNLHANTVLDTNNAQLTLLGGVSDAPNTVTGIIYHENTMNGQGRVNVGNGTSASYINFTGSVGKTDSAIRFFNVIGSNSASNASTAKISANSYFAGVGGGILVGENATLNVAEGAALSFSNGATIEGSADGCGTLVLNKAVALPVAIGATHSLSTVRLDNFNNGEQAVLSKAVHATTLDLRGTSIVGLDANATAITNFTRGDNGTSAVYYDGTENLTVSNIRLPLTLYNTGQLTVSNATAGVNFNGGTTKNSTLILANNAFIGDIGLSATNTGILRTLGNATFTGAIGSNTSSTTGTGDITHSLGVLELTGSSNQTVSITNATHIYATKIAHNNVVLDLHEHNVTMYGNYSATDATLTLGEKKLTIGAGQEVTLSGAIIINATYTGHEQTILDLSGVNLLNADSVTTITLNIDNGSSTPPSSETIRVIKPPAAFTVPDSIKISMGTSDPKWQMTTFGTLIYTKPIIPSTAPSTNVSNVINANNVAVVGATSKNIIQAVNVIGISNLNISNNGTPTFKPNSQGVVSVVPSTSTSYVSVAIGNNKPTIPSTIINYAAQYNTDEAQKGWLGILSNTVEEMKVQNKELDVDGGTRAVFALIASEQNLISPDIANTLIEQDKNKISNALANQMVSVAVIGGRSSIEELANRVNQSVSNASNNQLAAVGLRQSQTFVHNNNLNNIMVIADNDTMVAEDVSQGIAAGSSPYDKFGVWASVNLGQARQKEYKGASGFNSVSKGITIGADTMLNERKSIGFALSNSYNNVKHKDVNRGNKTDTSSWLGVIYGNYQFKSNKFIRAAALFNHTSVNSKELRVVGRDTYGVAKAKYNLISYGGEMVFGLVHKFKNDTLLTPTIGARVIHNNKSSYSQKGDTNQNNSIATNEMNNYSALAGLSLSKNITRDGIVFTPEAHVNLQYGINQQTPKGTSVSAFSPSQTNNFIGNKSSKIISTYGLSLTGVRDGIEMGINADMTIADRYVGYQGALKLRVKL